MIITSLLFTFFIAFYGLDTIINILFKNSSNFNPYMRIPSELSLLLGDPLKIFFNISLFEKTFEISSISSVKIFLFGCFWILNSIVISGAGSVKEKVGASFLFASEILLIFIVVSPGTLDLFGALASLIAPVLICTVTNLLISPFRRVLR